MNGKTVITDQYKWSVFGSERVANFEDLNISSNTRMVFEDNGVLWNINFINPTNAEIAIDISLDVIGFISQYKTDWQWWYPFPSIRANEKSAFDNDLIGVFFENLHEVKKVRDSIGIEAKNTEWANDDEILRSKFYQTAVSEGKIIVVKDQNSSAVTAFSFAMEPSKIIPYNSGATVQWKMTIPPNSSKALSYSMSFGDDRKVVTTKAFLWTKNFNSTVNRIS